MANEIRIPLLVDATRAREGVDDFSKSIARLRSEVIGADKAFKADPTPDRIETTKALTHATQQYIKGIERLLSSYDQTIPGMQKFQKALNLLSSEFQKLDAVTSTPFASHEILEMSDRIQQMRREIDRTNESLKTEKEHWSQVAELADRALEVQISKGSESVSIAHRWTEALEKQQKSIDENTARELESCGRIEEAYRLRIRLIEQERQAASDKALGSVGPDENLDEALAKINSYYDTERSRLEESFELKRMMYAYETEQREAALRQQEDQEILEGIMNAKVIEIRRNLEAAEAELVRIARSGDTTSNAFEKARRNVSKLRTELQKAGHVDFVSRVKNLVKSFVSAQAVVFVMRKAFTAISNTIRESSKAAAEAEQVFSKLSTVFDSAADSARRKADELSTTLGVASSTAASALSTIGDLLQAQGMGVSRSLETAAEWAQKLQDIIAFKDLDMSLEQFAQDFMSGAAGNLRNFRTFGSIVKESAVKARLAAEGLDELSGEQMELAKVTIRANMALEQQANAMGATQREWETTLSIGRRLTETQKEFHETLGESINSFVNPLKQLWTDILDSITKAIKAQRDFNDGQNADAGIYDIRGNDNDRKRFEQSARSAYSIAEMVGGGYHISGLTDGRENRPQYMTALEALDESLRLFNADVSDLRNLFGNQIGEAAYAYLQSLEDARDAAVAEQQARERRYNSIIEAQDAANALADTISMMEGLVMDVSQVSVSQDSRALGSQAYTDSIISSIGDNVAEAVRDVVDQLASGNYMGFVSASDKAFGTYDESGTLEQMQATIRAVYNAVKNAFLENAELAEDGSRLSERENAILESLIARYTEAGDRIAELAQEAQDAADAQARVTQALNDMASLLSSSEQSYGSYMQQKRLKGEYSSLPEELSEVYISRDTALEDALSRWEEARAALVEGTDEFTKAQGDYNAAVSYITDLYAEMASDVSGDLADRIGASKQDVASLIGSIGALDDTVSVLNALGITSANSSVMDDAADAYRTMVDAISGSREELVSLGMDASEVEDFLSDLEAQGLSNIRALVAREDAEISETEAIEAAQKALEDFNAALSESGQTLSSWQGKAADYASDTAARAALTASGMDARLADNEVSRQGAIRDVTREREERLRPYEQGTAEYEAIYGTYETTIGHINRYYDMLGDAINLDIAQEIIDAQQRLQDDITSAMGKADDRIIGASADLVRFRYSQGLSGDDAYKDHQMQLFDNAREALELKKELLAAGVSYEDAEKKRIDYLDAINRLAEEQYDAIVAQNEELERRKRIEEATSNISSIGSTSIDAIAQRQAVAGYMSSEGVSEDVAQLMYAQEQAIRKVRDSFMELDDKVISIGDSIYTEDELVKVITQDYRDQIDALAEVNTIWGDLGRSALSSLGTVGGAVNTFTDGQGDIWSDIVAVLLDILESSEYWGDVVDVLDRLVAPILPLVEMITYTLSSLEPVWEIVTFLLKMIAATLAGVMGAVNLVVDMFQWMWDNLKIALRNVAVDVYNLFHARKRDREDYRALSDYFDETLAETNEVLDHIWHGVDSLKDDSYLKAYQELLDKGLIDDSQMADYVNSHYGTDYGTTKLLDGASSYSQLKDGTYIQRQNVSITIEGSNLSVDEIRTIIRDAMEGRSYSSSVAYA